MSRPVASSIRLPTAYGTPRRQLEWAEVRARLEGSMHYWLATTRSDGRPHVVPVDGLWIEDRWYFGGAPETVSQRNLRSNPRTAVHLPDAAKVVIVEGTAAVRTLTGTETEALAAASQTKYGYAPPASAYAEGVWALAPCYVLAWNNLGDDATRFDF